MPNIIEKKMPKHFRIRTTTLLLSALGFFLALQFNTVIQGWFNKYLPLNGQGIGDQALYLIILTIVIITLSVMIERGLDGK